MTRATGKPRGRPKVITQPVADNDRLATNPGRCSLCKFGAIRPGDRIARLTATGEWAHIACIASLREPA